MSSNDNDCYTYSISVVMYGGAQEAFSCIESLMRHSPKGTLLYLIVNASPDGAMQTLQCGELGSLPENVICLPQKTNKGFGAGHNAALPLLESRYHVVANPDVTINSDVLNAMGQWMDAHPDVAMTTPRFLNEDGTVQGVPRRRPALLPILARQLGLSFLKKYDEHYTMRDMDMTKEQDVTFCSGAFFMIRTDVYKKIGGFDEKYFMYVEDADITQKVLREGAARAVYLPFAAVTHRWDRAARRRLEPFLWQIRSMVRFFGKWGFMLK
jgi:GT2 family glycosyltransferase